MRSMTANTHSQTKTDRLTFEENPTGQDEPNQVATQSSSKVESLKKQTELQRQAHVLEPQEWSNMYQDNRPDGKQFAEQSRLKHQSQEKPAAREHLQEQSGPKKQTTNTESMELCWYCMKSHSLAELNTPQLDLENKVLMPPNGGDRLTYQQDPRPHFGVARSSRSTSFPLWGSEGHREMKRGADEDDMNSISNCPHCHLGLPLHTLRWHAEKCLLFEGPRNDI